MLVSQFDFVGIAERLPETMAGLGRIYAKTPAGMGILARDIGVKAGAFKALLHLII